MTTLPWSRPFTRDDLDAMPDDGHRYELLDGTLIVSPAPRLVHQRVVLGIAMRLELARTADFEVIIAPFDVVLANDTVLQPDVLVARRDDLTDRDLPAAPLLAAEVLSPSTRRIDQLLKPSRYAAAGVACYWVVDPDEPSVTAYELGARGAFAEVARAVGDESITLDQPFPVTINPAELVAFA